MSALGGSAGFSGRSSVRPLVVGIHPWIGYQTLYLAREFRWLPREIAFRDGNSAIDSLAALQAGQIDAACLTLDEVLRARAQGVPLSIALVFDVSAGADVVLARPSIRSLADLAGKRLGVEQGALGALVLKKLLETANLPASGLSVVDLPLNRQLAAWRAGEIDAVITYEPVADLLRREGAHPLFDSRQMPDTIFDLLAVRADRVEGRQTALIALGEGHFRAHAHLRRNRQDAIHRIAGLQSMTPDEVERALAGVMLPSLEVNRSYLATHDPRLVQAAKTLSGLMAQRGLLPREDDLNGLIAPDWLPRDER